MRRVVDERHLRRREHRAEREPSRDLGPLGRGGRQQAAHRGLEHARRDLGGEHHVVLAIGERAGGHQHQRLLARRQQRGLVELVIVDAAAPPALGLADDRTRPVPGGAGRALANAPGRLLAIVGRCDRPHGDVVDVDQRGGVDDPARLEPVVPQQRTRPDRAARARRAGAARRAAAAARGTRARRGRAGAPSASTAARIPGPLSSAVTCSRHEPSRSRTVSTTPSCRARRDAGAEHVDRRGGASTDRPRARGRTGTCAASRATASRSQVRTSPLSAPRRARHGAPAGRRTERPQHRRRRGDPERPSTSRRVQLTRRACHGLHQRSRLVRARRRDRGPRRRASAARASGRLVTIFGPGRAAVEPGGDAVEVGEPGLLAVGAEERHHDLAALEPRAGDEAVAGRGRVAGLAADHVVLAARRSGWLVLP